MHARISKEQEMQITALASPCPFAKWGMDILGSFSLANAKKKFIIIAVDYFTVWIKVEALVTIITDKVISFL